MAYTFHIKDSSNPKVLAFLEYIKTLDFVILEKSDIVQEMTEKKIINQAHIAEKEIQNGKIRSHEQVLKDLKNW